MPGRRNRWDANSLLSSGLLAVLLAAVIGVEYIAMTTVAVSAGWVGAVQNVKDFSPPWWLNLAAFSVITVTVLPVARVVREHINDLVYGQHDDAYVLIARVNQLLQSMTAPQLTLPAVAEAVAGALHLPHVVIEIAGSDPPLRYAFGTPPARTESGQLPITYLERPIGTLGASARAANRPLTEGDLRLLREVAQQLGIALRAAQLTAELQASRERLVIAREEERRRIRNDLHDGLAPTLSSLQLQLGAMRRIMPRDAGQAEAMADGLGEDLRHATAEIRRIVYDLRPPMLDEFGLVGAIRHLSGTTGALSIEISAPDPMPKLPAAVEVAAYRIASEAIHNVIKHAQAAHCLVCIETGSGQLSLSVSDDGRGLPAGLIPGVGLRSMRERATELGGTLTIEAGAAGGACVHAQLPLTDR